LQACRSVRGENFPVDLYHSALVVKDMDEALTYFGGSAEAIGINQHAEQSLICWAVGYRYVPNVRILLRYGANPPDICENAVPLLGDPFLPAEMDEVLREAIALRSQQTHTL